jgi:hypothetical protein
LVDKFEYYLPNGLTAVTNTATSGRLVLYGDNFDSGMTTMDGWSRSSTTYITRTTGTYKIGTAAMEINGYYNATTYVNTEPYRNIILTFKMAAYSLESGETLQAFYNIGSGDVVCATIADGSDDGVSVPTW